MMSSLQRATYSLAAIVFAALILALPAFWNGYPLLYPDTGTYLWSGFQEELLIGRPILYGYFLASLSFGKTLWTPLILQCLLVSSVCYQFIDTVLEAKAKTSFLLIVGISITSLISSIAWTSSQLIPDFIAPLLLMISLSFLWSKVRWKQVVTLALLCTLIATHNSHILIMTLFSCSILLGRRLSGVHFRNLRKEMVLLGVSLMMILVLPTIHFWIGGEFKLSKGEHVFLLNRTREVQVLQEYLADNCHEKPYELCNYTDLIEGDFMWDVGRSPLYIMGGWEATEAEFNAILKDMAKSPKYAPKVVWRVIKDWPRQLTSFTIEPFRIMGEGSGPYFPIKTHLGPDVNSMLTSKQATEGIDPARTNRAFIFMGALSLLGLLVLCIKARTSRMVILSMVSFITVNAIICATFSLVISRYQARVMWLPIFIGVALSVRWVCGILVRWKSDSRAF